MMIFFCIVTIFLSHGDNYNLGATFSLDFKLQSSPNQIAQVFISTQEILAS